MFLHPSSTVCANSYIPYPIKTKTKQDFWLFFQTYKEKPVYYIDISIQTCCYETWNWAQVPPILSWSSCLIGVHLWQIQLIGKDLESYTPVRETDQNWRKEPKTGRCLKKNWVDGSPFYTTMTRRIQPRWSWTGFRTSLRLSMIGHPKPRLKIHIKKKQPVERHEDGSSDASHPIWWCLRGSARKNWINFPKIQVCKSCRGLQKEAQSCNCCQGSEY